jgi:pimeloyl-ACP methyl ester carboxylesterase
MTRQEASRMRATTATARRLLLIVAAMALGLATLAPAAGAGGTQKVDVRFEQLQGFKAPGTPAKYNKVGVIKTGPSDAKNILVLVPGTSASAAYFEPLAKDVVRKSKGWQVWAIERRENFLEDHSVLNQAKKGKATSQQLFDYYLGFVTDPAITKHFQFIPDSDVAYARDWGMNVEVEDMRRVVEEAKKQGGKVVLGGHSLGGSITTAYATWDFNGKAGAKDLAGLVFIDGGSSPTPSSPDQANLQLQALQNGSPWLTFGGIPAPYAGLFNATGSTGVKIAPNDPSLGYAWPALPANLKPPSRRRTRANTDTPSTSRRHRWACAPPRRTSASSRRAAIRAVGTAPARSPRSRATPRCSRDGVSRAATAPPGTTRNA